MAGVRGEPMGRRRSATGPHHCCPRGAEEQHLAGSVSPTCARARVSKRNALASWSQHFLPPVWVLRDPSPQLPPASPQSLGPVAPDDTSLVCGAFSTCALDLHTPILTFLSDYGHDDDFVGVCRGVIASVCPRARVIDITHGIRRHDVRAGALVLRNALPYMPAGVHLAVVDPGVGGGRRAVALRLTDGRLLVGPDNGLLSLAAGAYIAEAADIGRSPFRLEPVSATFHGRDVFAPVAAHLAQGATLADAGEPLDPDALVRIALPSPVREGGALIAHVIYVDGYGNVALDAVLDDLPAADQVSVARASGPITGDEVVSGRAAVAARARTFADAEPGGLLLYEDAYGALALALNGGDAAARLGLAAGDEVRIAPA